MPRTKSSKTDKCTPPEKLEQLGSVDRFIFFQNFDGITTDGVMGFNVHDGPPGSTKHWASSGICSIALTKNQFCSKGEKIALIAEAFVATNTVPPNEMRPRITTKEIQVIREENTDRRTPTEKLEAVTNEKELFIFFQVL